MAEFEFSCPDCKKDVHLDVRYAGSRIDCPICHKHILVPSAGEPAVQLKKSTLIKAGIIAGCGLIVVLLVLAAIHFLAGSRSITFQAFVDGSDRLKLSGNRLWVEHVTWQPPTKMSVNGGAWDPIWITNPDATPDDSANPASAPAQSSTQPFALSHAFKPGNPDKIKIVKRLGRGAISIVQLPKPENDRTLAILIDDGPMGGADTYEFTVSW